VGRESQIHSTMSLQRPMERLVHNGIVIAAEGRRRATSTVISMNAPFPISRNDYRLREEAWRIAWNFLDGSGQIAHTLHAHALLSEAIVALMDQGVTNRLKLANLAIIAYQRSMRDEVRADGRASRAEQQRISPRA